MTSLAHFLENAHLLFDELPERNEAEDFRLLLLELPSFFDSFHFSSKYKLEFDVAEGIPVAEAIIIKSEQI